MKVPNILVPTCAAVCTASQRTTTTTSFRIPRVKYLSFSFNSEITACRWTRYITTFWHIRGGGLEYLHLVNDLMWARIILSMGGHSFHEEKKTECRCYEDNDVDGRSINYDYFMCHRGGGGTRSHGLLLFLWLCHSIYLHLRKLLV